MATFAFLWGAATTGAGAQETFSAGDLGTWSVNVRPLKGRVPDRQKLESIHREFQEEAFKGPAPGLEQASGENPLSIADLFLKVWDIIQENKAVLNVSSQNVKALPYLAKDHWEALTGWKPERGLQYSMTLTNLYGMTVVDLVYEVRLIYGGSVKKAGKYIASARVIPRRVNVLWGYELDVGVQEVAVQNLGTEKNPFAAITLDVNLSFGSILKKSSETRSFRLDADGAIRDLTSGKSYFQ